VDRPGRGPLSSDLCQWRLLPGIPTLRFAGGGAGPPCGCCSTPTATPGSSPAGEPDPVCELREDREERPVSPRAPCRRTTATARSVRDRSAPSRACSRSPVRGSPSAATAATRSPTTTREPPSGRSPAAPCTGSRSTSPARPTSTSNAKLRRGSPANDHHEHRPRHRGPPRCCPRSWWGVPDGQRPVLPGGGAGTAVVGACGWTSTPVTSAAFRRFVKATGHITLAEQSPPSHRVPWLHTERRGGVRESRA
jgi:hypothetical protein